MNPLLIRRRGMMVGKALPYDAEIEYLEAPQTGSTIQYVNTGIVPTVSTKVEILFMILVRNTNGYFGARKEPYRFCCTSFNVQQQFAFAMTNNTWPVGRYNASLNTFELCIAENGNFSNNGIDGGSTPVLNSFPINDYFYLFANKNNEGVFATTSRSSTRTYYCKIWEAGQLIRDFIPVRVGQVGYMYDRVSGQLFGNSGTGDFILGPDIQ